MGQMKSVVCVAPGELRLGHGPIPTAGENEVLLRVRRIGVCGTDMAGLVPAIHVFPHATP